MKRTKYPTDLTSQYPTDLVFAAACAADRHNQGEYISMTDHYNASKKPTNKSLMLNFLKDPLEITEQDFTKADLVIRNCQALSFKVLGGQRLSEFESKAMELASGETIRDRDIGVIAYLPILYTQSEKKRSTDQRLRDCEHSYCGPVDSKVTLSVEILSKIYSQNYNCHFLTGITNDNLAVSFATSHGHDFELNNTYTISAKVKDHYDSWVTKLNFVKIKP